MEIVAEIQIGNNEILHHDNGSVYEKDRRDINNIELVALKDPLVIQNEKRVSLMLSIFLIGLIG